MAWQKCWSCGNSYDGWECQVCSGKRLAEEQLRQAERQHREGIEAIEQAALDAEMAAAEASEEHRETIANAWKLQSAARSERAHALFRSGMFDEAYALAVQSVKQDPGNLDGFWVAASSLLSLHQTDRARPYLEKQIQLLSLPDYRHKPNYCSYVLELLLRQDDLFLLRDAFSSVITSNLRYWSASTDVANGARKLIAILAEADFLSEACSVLEWVVRAERLSHETLRTALALVKRLIARAHTTNANKITELVSSKSTCLLTECYVREMCFLLGCDGKARVDAFLRKAPIDLRRAVIADVAQIRQISDRGEISKETVATVMHSVSERILQWRPTIEAQINQAAVASARTQPIKTRGGIAAVLSFFILFIASIAFSGERGLGPESVGILLFFGDLIGSLLIGALFERYLELREKEKITASNLLAAFTVENRTLGELGLPTLEVPSLSTTAPRFRALMYFGIVLGYLAAWFGLMASQGKPAVLGPPFQSGFVSTCAVARGWRDYTAKTEFTLSEPICAYAEALNVSKDNRIDVSYTFALLGSDNAIHATATGRCLFANTTSTGCWFHVSDLRLPANAPIGAYTLQVTMRNNLTGQRRQGKSTFVVNPEMNNGKEGSASSAKPFANPESNKGVHRAGRDGVTLPTCIYCPEPIYTDEARNAKYQGTLDVDATVTPDGRVTDPHVAHSPGLGLEEKAIAAVGTWKLRPCKDSNGIPVACLARIEVAFHLF